jgi:hypothetical protein
MVSGHYQRSEGQLNQFRGCTQLPEHRGNSVSLQPNLVDGKGQLGGRRVCFHGRIFFFVEGKPREIIADLRIGVEYMIQPEQLIVDHTEILAVAKIYGQLRLLAYSISFRYC